MGARGALLSQSIIGSLDYAAAAHPLLPVAGSPHAWPAEICRSQAIFPSVVLFLANQ